jgi:Flp pilus assembly protein TadG
MKRKWMVSQGGQVIVIVALMMAALLAILALTIDGGLTYFQRRLAQNAADAAALAGARAMCVTGGGDPVAAALDYAARNGIPDPATNVAVSTSQAGTVRSVTVTITLPYDTFFAGVIGIEDTQVGALAEAACYPPCAAGVLPIAWSCTPPDVGNGSISDSCNVFPHDEDGCSYEDGDPFYIIADSESIEEDIVCLEPGEDPGESSDPDLFYVDCDIDNDGQNDVEFLSGANRSWLNLDGGASGASEMIDWVRGKNVPDVQVHTWFQGTAGVRDSVYQAVEDYRLNQNVSIPVFDMVAPGLKNKELPTPFHDEDIFVDSGAGDYFHVITYATFHVTCVSTGANDHCPAKDDLIATGAIQKPNTKTIEGCFSQALVEGRGAPGECTTDAGAYVLKLIR